MDPDVERNLEALAEAAARATNREETMAFLAETQELGLAALLGSPPAPATDPQARKPRDAL